MRVKLSIATALVLVSGGITSALAHEGLPSDYNYRDDIRPIFMKHCAGCHRPGGVGPMSLLSYSDAVPWANAVKMQVLSDQMPPWLPTEGVGAFRHTRSLAPGEIDILLDWIIGQTPEGEPLTPAELEVDAPPEWAMGTPDLVLTPEAEIVIGEDDYEVSRCLVLPSGTDRSRIASGFEVKPELATVLRRATIGLGDACDTARPLATWLPGQGSVSLAGERGHELPAGASLTMELLYVKGWEDEGKRLIDRSALGVRFSDAATSVSTIHVSATSHTFAEDVELVAIYAEPLEDQPLSVELVRPGGHVEPILIIQEYTPKWAEKYVLAEPLALGAGTELRLSQPAVWVDFTAPAPAAE